jgi:hypothetical protein
MAYEPYATILLFPKRIDMRARFSAAFQGDLRSISRECPNTRNLMRRGQADDGR